MKDEYRRRLTQLLGDSVSFDQQICAAYDHDLGEMPGVLMAQIKACPTAVVVPKTTQDVVKALTFAGETGTPVTPRGQASSGFGGAIPTRGGLLLDLSSLNRVLAVDQEAMTVDVEPGVVWQGLSKELQRCGLDNRICPTSAPSATVGGWFAMGGVGIGSLRYGSVADVVEEIDVVGLDGRTVTCRGDRMQPYYQTCGSLGIITRLRLKCRKAEALRPYAIEFPDAFSLQAFMQEAIRSFDIDTAILHSDGYVAMRKAAGGHHSLAKGHFLAILAIPESQADDAKLALLTKMHKGEQFSEQVAREEWGDRFYPMRIKKVGPTVLVGEFYLPVDNFAAAWEEIAGDLSRDCIGMEALAISKSELTVLVYLPECSKDLLYPVRMAKAVRPAAIARRHGGRPYTAGMWFAAESKEVLGKAKYAGYRRLKKELDPENLLNPGKIVAPGMRWLPILNLGTVVHLGSALASPFARFLSYRGKGPSPSGEHHEH
ncbi:FAD-binding oxidoreductase [Geomonas subterranea]|uniref:D-lactate dehydrogenase (cytochrome) n=1 Tax=Geomonas subterranea TaxID=2847989 RepID=A0ABX8LP07_9BACT|nr:FAD-binding oxidoreductase [Geomonas subterranea]QXE92652.1 FAD-binding oxidoreductase [Geomonas subterranea]QXM09249.1 FAD-binding oxidoreductase [Geomonas subterranea]